jgi:group I intron endonuclease
MKKVTIYKLTNPLEFNRCYVGATTMTLKARMSRHKSAANGGQAPINKAIAKYGFENFIVEVLDETHDVEFGFEFMEPFYIKQNDAYTKGYNLTLGGRGSKGWVPPEAFRKRSREFLNNHPELKPKDGYTKGSVFYTNGIESIRLYEGDAIPEGFFPGRHWTPNPEGYWAEGDSPVTVQYHIRKERQAREKNHD